MKKAFSIIFIFIVSLIAFESCKKRPSGVLEENKMIDFLVDMKLADAYALMNYNGPRSDIQRKNLARSVMEQHGVTQEQIDSTLAWYGRNLDDYSMLYEKVDVKLKERQETLNKEKGVEEIKEIKEEGIWPYELHGSINENSLSSGWNFSIESPNFEKGGRLSWTMHLLNAANLKGMIGVEYTDGSLETYSNTFTNTHKIELPLQTDTAKQVGRILGYLYAKDKKDLPVYADSIKMNMLPYDSLEYGRKRMQKKYGALSSIK